MFYLADIIGDKFKAFNDYLLEAKDTYDSLAANITPSGVSPRPVEVFDALKVVKQKILVAKNGAYNLLSSDPLRPAGHPKAQEIINRANNLSYLVARAVLNIYQSLTLSARISIKDTVMELAKLDFSPEDITGVIKESGRAKNVDNEYIASRFILPGNRAYELNDSYYWSDQEAIAETDVRRRIVDDMLATNNPINQQEIRDILDITKPIPERVKTLQRGLKAPVRRYNVLRAPEAPTRSELPYIKPELRPPEIPKTRPEFKGLSDLGEDFDIWLQKAYNLYESTQTPEDKLKAMDLMVDGVRAYGVEVDKRDDTLIFLGAAGVVAVLIYFLPRK